jgi:hypothetical protein
MGVEVMEYPDGMEIVGGAKLKGATISTYHDHRIAMAFAIAGLFAEGDTIIEGSECIGTSYPGFEHDLDLFMKGDTGAAPIRAEGGDSCGDATACGSRRRSETAVAPSQRHLCAATRDHCDRASAAALASGRGGGGSAALRRR